MTTPADRASAGDGSAQQPTSGRKRAAVRSAGLLVVAVLLAVIVSVAVRSRDRDPPGMPDGPPGKVLFDGDFGRGLTPRRDQQVVHPERIELVDDPLGPSRKVAKFTVHDDDIGPTENPRATITSPPMFEEGAELWVGWSTMFPSDGFPSSVPGWLTFETVYGPPGDGPGPRHMQVQDDEILWRRNQTYGFDVPWSMPLVRDRWIDFVIHQKQSGDPDVGFVELWVNTGSGWEQQRMDGQLRFHTRTLDETNDDAPNRHTLTLYRQRGMFEVVTLYHAARRIGTSFRAVAPTSHDP